MDGFVNYVSHPLSLRPPPGPDEMTRTAALVLSGGESSRFGGRPKALLSTGDRSAVRRISEVCLSAEFDPVCVVAGPHRFEVAMEVRGLPVELVPSRHWFEGRTASVQAGLEAIPSDRDVLLWPVDHPFVRPETVDLLESVKSSDQLGLWFIPTFDGHGGHPVLWRSAVREPVLELRTDAPLRALLPEFGPQVRRVRTEDPGVLANVDTPEEYRKAYGAWRSEEGR